MAVHFPLPWPLQRGGRLPVLVDKEVMGGTDPPSKYPPSAPDMPPYCLMIAKGGRGGENLYLMSRVYVLLFYNLSKLIRWSSPSTLCARVRLKLTTTAAMSFRLTSHLLRGDISAPLLSKIERTLSNSSSFPSSNIAIILCRNRHHGVVPP